MRLRSQKPAVSGIAANECDSGSTTAMVVSCNIIQQAYVMQREREREAEADSQIDKRMKGEATTIALNRICAAIEIRRFLVWNTGTASSILHTERMMSYRARYWNIEARGHRNTTELKVRHPDGIYNKIQRERERVQMCMFVVGTHAYTHAF